MKKTVFTFGILSGIIICTLMAIAMSLANCDSDFGPGMVIGYSSMIIAFSITFVAVKRFRDKYSGGVIRFGKAFLIGLYIALISSTMYVAGWAIDYKYFMPDFMDKYSAKMEEKIRGHHYEKTREDKEIAKIESMNEGYKNPVVFTLYTYAEILPIGLLVSLISALILKRKVPKPAK